MWFKFAFVLLALLFAEGCTVRQADVPNRPPMVGHDIGAYSLEKGTIRPTTISLFFWPIGVSGQELREMVGNVNTLSKNYDAISADVQPRGIERSKLESEIMVLETQGAELLSAFQAQDCVSKWAQLPAGTDPATVEDVTDWKPEPTDPLAQQSRKDCIANQEKRLQGKAEMNAKRQRSYDITDEIDALMMKQAMAYEEIRRAVDRNFPTVVENWLNISAASSEVVIKNDNTVRLVFRDFLRNGNHQSTEGSYDSVFKSLKFSLPELDKDGKTTGALYEFELGRNADFLGYARFTGDMKLRKDGQVIRNGSAKIEGTLEF